MSSEDAPIQFFDEDGNRRIVDTVKAFERAVDARTGANTVAIYDVPEYGKVTADWSGSRSNFIKVNPVNNDGTHLGTQSLQLCLVMPTSSIVGQCPLKQNDIVAFLLFTPQIGSGTNAIDGLALGWSQSAALYAVLTGPPSGNIATGHTCTDIAGNGSTTNTVRLNLENPALSAGPTFDVLDASDVVQYLPYSPTIGSGTNQIDGLIVAFHQWPIRGKVGQTPIITADSVGLPVTTRATWTVDYPVLHAPP